MAKSVKDAFITGFKDVNGKNIKIGKNSVKLEIKGVGEGKCEICIMDDVWQIYHETQGYVPLEMMLQRDDVVITSLKK